MSDGDWRKLYSFGWLAAALLALSACGPPPQPYYDPPSLGGPERHDAERTCAEGCANSAESRPDDPVTPTVRVDESIEASTEANGARDPAQERDDLRAQWRSALAAENMEALVYQQIGWTVFEILLLFGTLTAGVIAIRDARVSAERQLRAYLVITPGHVEIQDDLQRIRFELQPFINNTGQTPAYDVEYTGVARLLPDPLPDNFDFTIQRPVNRPSRSVLGPGQNFFMVNAADAFYQANEVHQALAAGPLRLFTYGVVTYRDAFKKKRTTKFCFFIMWGARGIPAWFTHHSHNEAD